MRTHLLTVGLLSLPLLLTGAAMPTPAVADDRGLPLPRGVAGPAALDALGDDIDEAAALNRLPVAGLTRILSTDSSAHLDGTGRLYYVEPAPETPSAMTAQAAAFPYSDTFTLHSLPGADRTIFLDFDGHDVSNTGWNPQTPARFYAGMSMDVDPGFSEAEQDVIQETWQRIAEDYAPMAVDVTTEDPGSAALERADAADQQFGMRALFTGESQPATALCGACGGIAFLSGFDNWQGPHPGMMQPAWIFTSRTGHNPRVIADAASHELGHTLGLSHDGLAEPVVDYYEGRDQWFPIMGSSYRQLSQFSNGDYVNSSNQQDDYAVMVTRGAPLRADDHANSAAGATAIDTFGTFPGVISTRTDTDWFTVTHCGGVLSVDAAPAPAGPDLDIKLTVRDSSGAALATVNPQSSFGVLMLGASYSATLAPGTYQLAIDGVGQGDAVDGYSDYGSRGKYALSVGTSCTAPVAPAVPQAVTVQTADNGTGATLSWASPASTGGAALTSYTVQRSGGVPEVLGAGATSHIFTGLAPGTAYTFTVRATNSVGSGPTATVGKTTPKAATAPRIQYAATPGAGSVELNWMDPLDYGGRSITGYVVQRTGGSPVNLPADARVHTFSGLTGGSYTLAVRAVTSFGPGAWATTSWVEPGPPGPVQNLTVVPDGSFSIQVDWTPPASDGERPIQYYTVSVLGGATLFVGANDWSETLHGLDADTIYQVTVRAHNEFGDGASAQGSAHTWPEVHAPGPVSFHYVDATPTSVTAGWDPPNDPGGTVTGYEVRLGSGAWIPVSASTFTRKFTGLTGSRSYTVWVRGVNASGSGTATSTTLVTDAATRPSAPRIGAAVSGSSGGLVTATAVWRAPLTNGGAAISSYKVTALKIARNGSVISRVTRTAGAGARKLAMTLKAGRYRFVVAAVNAKGTSTPSARSNAVAAR
jgi:hypothetical protein